MNDYFILTQPPPPISNWYSSETDRQAANDTLEKRENEIRAMLAELLPQKEIFLTTSYRFYVKVFDTNFPNIDFEFTKSYLRISWRWGFSREKTIWRQVQREFFPIENIEKLNKTKLKAAIQDIVAEHDKRIVMQKSAQAARIEQENLEREQFAKVKSLVELWGLAFTTLDPDGRGGKIEIVKDSVFFAFLGNTIRLRSWDSKYGIDIDLTVVPALVALLKRNAEILKKPAN